MMKIRGSFFVLYSILLIIPVALSGKDNNVGTLYCTTKEGEVVVLKAEEKYELLVINNLGEKSYATPAVAGGKMYLRTFYHLLSIGKN